MIAALERTTPVVVAPECVNYCRPTSHLECPKGGATYANAVHRAARERATQLGIKADEPWNSSLALLTFVYGASLEAEMTGTLTKLSGERSYGHGADLIVLGATWASVMRTRPAGGSRSGARTAASPSGKELVELAWDDALTRAWRTALDACAAAARCLLRTVPETPRQAAAQPYLDFMAHVTPLASADRVGVIDSFSGTWSGVRAGVMAHHDSTRIHFSDTGRAYLAQLTLNALPLILGRRTRGNGASRPAKPAGEIRLDWLVPQPQAS